jgi:hypothetical protein
MGRGQLLQHLISEEANGSDRRESRRAVTDTTVSMSSGREPDSHAKRLNGSVVTRRPLPRGNHDPAWRGNQRVERVDEVRNSMGAMSASRETGCVLRGRNPGVRTVQTACGRTVKAREGMGARIFSCDHRGGQEASEERKPKEVSAGYPG